MWLVLDLPEQLQEHPYLTSNTFFRERKKKKSKSNNSPNYSQTLIQNPSSRIFS
jgi:hypothetical protein